MGSLQWWKLESFQRLSEDWNRTGSRNQQFTEIYSMNFSFSIACDPNDILLAGVSLRQVRCSTSGVLFRLRGRSKVPNVVGQMRCGELYKTGILHKSSEMDVPPLTMTHRSDIYSGNIIQSLLKALSLSLVLCFLLVLFSFSLYIFCHIVISNLVFLSHCHSWRTPITSLDEGKTSFLSVS